MVQKEITKQRGRPRAYDPDKALTDAQDAFWKKGYSATSLDELSAATGMNRPSLYGAFGDKHAIYLKTLERYVEAARHAMHEELDVSRPLETGLRRVYERALSIYFSGNDGARGCFMIGTAATEAVTDAEIRSILSEGLRELDRIFEARLRHAQTQGELDAAADPVMLAAIASGIFHTLAVRARAGFTRASLQELAYAAIRLMMSHNCLRPDTSNPSA